MTHTCTFQRIRMLFIHWLETRHKISKIGHLLRSFKSACTIESKIINMCYNFITQLNGLQVDKLWVSTFKSMHFILPLCRFHPMISLSFSISPAGPLHCVFRRRVLFVNFIHFSSISLSFCCISFRFEPEHFTNIDVKWKDIRCFFLLLFKKSVWFRR